MILTYKAIICPYYCKWLVFVTAKGHFLWGRNWNFVFDIDESPFVRRTGEIEAEPSKKMLFRESACTGFMSTETLPLLRLTIQVWCAFTVKSTVIVSWLPFETSGISNLAIQCNDSEGLNILLSLRLSFQNVHITLHSLPPGSISPPITLNIWHSEKVTIVSNNYLKFFSLSVYIKHHTTFRKLSVSFFRWSISSPEERNGCVRNFVWCYTNICFSNEKIFGNAGDWPTSLDGWKCYQPSGLPTCLCFLSGFSALALENSSSPAQGLRYSPRHIIVMGYTWHLRGHIVTMEKVQMNISDNNCIRAF